MFAAVLPEPYTSGILNKQLLPRKRIQLSAIRTLSSRPKLEHLILRGIDIFHMELTAINWGLRGFFSAKTQQQLDDLQLPRVRSLKLSECRFRQWWRPAAVPLVQDFCKGLVATTFVQQLIIEGGPFEEKCKREEFMAFFQDVKAKWDSFHPAIRVAAQVSAPSSVEYVQRRLSNS